MKATITFHKSRWSAIMKGKITNSLKPPLTKRPFEVCCWTLNDMPESGGWGRTLSMQDGWGHRVFAGATKYFRHKLMGQEILLKIFDGPQKVFLCCSFLIF